MNMVGMQAGWKVNINILTNQPAHFIENSFTLVKH